MKIKVITIDKDDIRLGIKVGDIFSVTGKDPDGDYYIDTLPQGYDSTYHIWTSRVLLCKQVEVLT